MSNNLKMIGIFVDVSNLYYCIGKKFPEKKLDYLAYLTLAQGENAIYRARAYGIELDKEASKFKTCLKHYGYEPIYKAPKIYENKETGEKHYRRMSWNVGITTDVVRLIDKLDIIILGSSDPELVPLVEWIKEKGRECLILACGISRELKAVANGYKEITEDYLKSDEPETVIPANTTE